jgi:ABC-type ATPase with predicted acetyltransferase domain
VNNKLQLLVTEFPTAFDGQFYFECQDGWYEIIRPVIEQIVKHNQLNPDEKIYPSQIKEKWGTLSFYTTSVTEILDYYISEAEKASVYTCEECGQPGELIASNWLYTACPQHTKSGQKTYAEFQRLQNESEKSK